MAGVRGQCECGAVRFEITRARPEVTVCHCSQCRRISGHLWASTRVATGDLRIDDSGSLRWYASSGFAKRGFCSTCGASLFYKITDADHYGVAAGCLTAPTGLSLGKHIFVRDQGDYYPRPDDAPALATY